MTAETSQIEDQLQVGGESHEAWILIMDAGKFMSRTSGGVS